MINRQMKCVRRSLVIGASALAIGIGSPALAQDVAEEDDANDGTIGEIVVTAQFREQALQDTPLAITAIDAALLDSRNQTDLSQIAAQAPNATLTQRTPASIRRRVSNRCCGLWGAPPKLGSVFWISP